MKHYQVYIDASATMRIMIPANNAEEAIEKAQEFVDSENFWNEFRKECEFEEPKVSDDVWNLTDDTWED